MDRRPLAIPFLSQQMSRRAALLPLLGLAAMPILPSQAWAQAHDHPPVFRTSRFQFTLIEPSTQFRAVTLTDLKGRPARLASVGNKILLVNLRATWCDACRTDLPLIERFHRVTAGQVQVAAVSAEKTDRNDINLFLDRLAIHSLPTYLDPEGKLVSTSNESAAALSAYGMPVTYLITPSDRIAGYISGVADWLSVEGQQLLSYYANA
jgi:thiol-disulfide isomerase/thioredoxin